MDRVTVTVSKRLTSRLAGNEKEEKRPVTAKQDKETLDLIKEDEEIRSALVRTKRVGKLLLKREDEEMKKLENLASELLQTPSLNPSLVPDPCKASRDACEECCNRTAGETLECLDHINVYQSCVNSHFTDFLQKVQDLNSTKVKGK